MESSRVRKWKLILCQETVQIKYALLSWRKISTMTVAPHCIIKCFNIFKYQLICMPVVKNFKAVNSSPLLPNGTHLIHTGSLCHNGKSMVFQRF